MAVARNPGDKRHVASIEVLGKAMSSGSLVRSRWAAIGAAVAVTLGGGGLIGVSAASGDASSLKTVTPTRMLDTREGAGGKISGETVSLQVAGGTSVVPDGASAVAVNLTVTEGERNQGYGFVTAFPCTAISDAVPNASTLNFVEVLTWRTPRLCLWGIRDDVLICLRICAPHCRRVRPGIESVDAYTKGIRLEVFHQIDA